MAPSGALKIMDKTAKDKTNSPQFKPMAKARGPIDAWTVALGRYAIIQNNLSLKLNLVLSKQVKVPSILNNKPIVIKARAKMPIL